MEAHQRRRYSTRTHGRVARQENTASFRQTLLSQCIVSTIVLVIALTVGLLPLPFARELRSNIKLALSQESSVESLTDAASGLSQRYNDLKTSIKTIFGGESIDGVFTENASIEAEDTTPEQEADATEDIEILSDSDAWIDENILHSINSGDYYEVSGSEKK